MASQRLKRLHRQALACQDRLITWSRQPDILELSAPEISSWSVGLHVEHLGKVSNHLMGHLGRILEDTAEKDLGRPKPIGYVVLLAGWIPRGKAPVPKAVAPERVNAQALEENLESTRQRLAALEPRLGELATRSGKVAHHVLGPFDGAQWLRFLCVHDNHHRKIIRDIGRAAA